MRKNTRSYLGAALTLALLYAIVSSAATKPGAAEPALAARPSLATRVGVVDIEAITQKANFVQQLKKRIEGEFDGRLQQYKARQEELAKLQDEINKQGSVLSEAAMAEKYKQAFQLKAQVDEEKFTIDKFISDSEKKEMEPAQERILQVVMEVAQSEGFDMILKRDLLVCGHPSVDISDKVLARLNAAPQPAAKAAQPADTAKKKKR